MSIFNSDFIEYLTLLNEYQVEYVLVGGMAVNLHGYRRTTGDMDIFVKSDFENHQKLKSVHLDFGMHMGEMDVLENFLDIEKYDVFTFGISPIQIDVLTACKGITFNHAFSNSVKMEVADNLEVLVTDYRSLITMKKAANRLRDQMDIEELKKIKSNSKNQ
ncbi:MAG: hypothetical protein ABFS32_10755 [Bacteroidota bacterium]